MANHFKIFNAKNIVINSINKDFKYKLPGCSTFKREDD